MTSFINLSTTPTAAGSTCSAPSATPRVEMSILRTGYSIQQEWFRPTHSSQSHQYHRHLQLQLRVLQLLWPHQTSQFALPYKRRFWGTLKPSITSMCLISSHVESRSLKQKWLSYHGKQHWTGPWGSIRKKTELEMEPDLRETRSQIKTVNKSPLSNHKMTIKVSTLNLCLGLKHKTTQEKSCKVNSNKNYHKP